MNLETRLFLVFVWSVAVLVGNVAALPLGAEDPKAGVSFQKEIAPILVENCVACHNAKEKKGNYDLSTFDAMMKAKKGKGIVAGKPEESAFYLMLTGDEEPTMPKDADLLPEALVKKVESWIAQGAKFDGPDKAGDLRSLLAKKEVAPALVDYSTPVPVTALAFDREGKTIAVSGYHEISFWETQTGKLVRRLPTRSQRIHSLAYSADGKLLLHSGGSPGQMGEVVVWETAAWKPMRELVRTGDIIYTAALSPDGKQVAAGGTDRLFRIWDLASGKELHQVENHADWILKIIFTPDGKRVITAGRDKTVKIWDQTTKEPILTFPGHTDAVYAVGIGADVTTAISAGADRKLRFWKMEGEAKQSRELDAHGNTVYALALSKDGKTVYSGGADNVIKAWDAANGNNKKTLQGHKDWIYSLAVSPDDKLVASGSWDGEVRIWEAASGKMIRNFIAVPKAAGATAASK